MTESVSPTRGAAPAGVASRPPARADGIVLIGEMEGSGYRTPPALARRADGQTVQLTPLLYATLAALDGDRDHAQLAQVVAEATGKPVNAENVVALVDKLRPLGLVAGEDGPDPELARSNPLLGLRLKVAVTDAEKTRRLTAPFAALFHAAVVVPVLLAFAWITWWILLDKGLASATHEAFARPGLLLTVLGVTVLSAGFHEFGHAAAARRGGATPGVMGAGLYLVWPAFYTDVTDSYRLGRAGRLRTDLGGLYFNAIIAVATVGVWWVSRYDAVLLLVATQILQMLRQLLPFVRFDGYHVLADLTGVPDLFQRIGPTLRSLVPWRETHPEARALKPWARAVVTAWVLTVVPLLLAVLVLMVLTLPRLVGTAWAGAGAQRDQMMAALGEGDLVTGAARAVAMVVVVLPVAAFGYVLVRLVRQVGRATWRRTRGRPLRRGVAGLLVLALVAVLALAWWPSDERYRPIQAYEGGTLGDVLPVSADREALVGSEGSGTVMWPDDEPLPSRAAPRLAAVLVPTAETDGEVVTGADPTSSIGGDGSPEVGDVGTAEPGTWIFPVDEPLAPDEGDTQALAVNTTDDTTTYAVAFALVWAEGDEPVDNTNEAYALASCERCAAVAVAFQVVLVVDDAVSVAPQNLAVSATYDCTSCLTYALAVQLFVTLDGPLGEDAMASIGELWEEIAAYGASIGQVPLDEIQDQLTAYEQQILAVIEADQGPLGEPTAPAPSTASSTPTQAPTPVPGGAPSPTDETSPSTSSAEPSASPSESTTSPTPTTSTSTSTSTEPTPTPTEATTSPAPVTPSPTPAP